MEALKAANETEMHQRVQEVREVLEADKIEALGGERANPHRLYRVAA